MPLTNDYWDKVDICSLSVEEIVEQIIKQAEENSEKSIYSMKKETSVMPTKKTYGLSFLSDIKDPLLKDLLGTPRSSKDYAKLYAQCADKVSPELKRQIDLYLGHLEN